MTIASVVLAAVLQAKAPSDTILAVMVPQRGIFDYTSGILQIIVLVLAAAMLGALTWVLLTARKTIVKAEQTMEKLMTDVRPVIKHATGIASDARETVARLKEDVAVVTDAANAISDRLLDAADVTARRIDEVNAVLDVVQDEIEQVAISSVAAVRGVRVGATEMASALARPRRNGGGAMSRTVREELQARRAEFDHDDDGVETE